MSDEHRVNRETAVFNSMMEHFIDRYQPRDLRERAGFSADIMTLMRQLQISQADTYGRIVSEMYARMPLSPIVTVIPGGPRSFTATAKEPQDAKPAADTKPAAT